MRSGLAAARSANKKGRRGQIKSIATGIGQRIRKNESGFTLIEMLIVVGIIVALAAAIVPEVVSFSGKGEEGQKSSEQSTVQSAMDAMMAEQGATTVTAVTANGINDWTANPGGTGVATLDGYMSITISTWFYCYGTDGKITAQKDDWASGC